MLIRVSYYCDVNPSKEIHFRIRGHHGKRIIIQNNTLLIVNTPHNAYERGFISDLSLLIYTCSYTNTTSSMQYFMSYDKMVEGGV